MIRFTKIVVSRANSTPSLVGMKAGDIARVEGHDDARDRRIKSRVIYKASMYQDSIMYSSNAPLYILKQIDKEERNNRRIK